MRSLPPICLGIFLTLSCSRTELVRVGPQGDGAHLVPTWQLLRPAGESLEFGGRPVDLVLSADGRFLFVKDNRGLVVIDAGDWKILQELPFPEGGGSMHGVAASGDGKKVYLTSAQNRLWEAAIGADGKARWSRGILLPGPKTETGREKDSHPGGLALSPGGETAYVCLSRNNSLGIVDLERGALVREIPAGVAPFDVALSPGPVWTAYVSNWGGRHPRRGEPTTKSSGTDVVVDQRGIAASGTVSFVDLRDPHDEVTQVETGLHPSDLELRRDGQALFSANANSDTVSAIFRYASTTILVRPDPNLPFGSAPNALALSPDGRRLFVACGGNNAVAVIAPLEAPGGESHVEGFIPTAWYPGALATDGKHLYIACIKGLGSRRREPRDLGWHVTRYLGTVTKVAIPDAEALQKYTAQVREDARVPQILRAWERSQSRKKPAPVPAVLGEPSVFEHVVYVIKENRTYDQVFGDLPRGNGDPELCLFDREVTPNHHALAEQFILLDNFYCNGVTSADGHSWATEGNVTDHLEKSFGGFTRAYTWGDDPLTYSSSGFIWDDVLLHGLSFINYGEMDYAETVPGDAPFAAVYRDFLERTGKIRFTQNIGIEPLRRYTCPSYPGWNLRIPDVRRAEIFLEELRKSEERDDWPNFIILYLPNDHTSGTSPGAPTPRAQVADNDLALGKAVEGITRSRFWPATCIFVIEDDPQDGFDHVDGHRSLCLVISPYAKRRQVVSHFYNQTAVLHTMERILGIPPMNQMDALAPLMSECFTEQPDFTPYTALPNRIPLDELNPEKAALRGPVRRWAEESERQRFDRFDEADEDTLNRILWHMIKGAETPYPAHLAGAHGRGLKALGLKLADENGEDGE